jgi:cytochrome c6
MHVADPIHAAAALALTPLLAAAKSMTPLYIAAGLLVCWVIVVSLGFLRKPGFPGNATEERVVIAITATLVAAYIAMTVVTSGEKASSTTQRGPSKPAASTPAAGGPGKQLFAATCGQCHTLRAAGTSGEVGPNLDQLKPSTARVLAAIKNGGTGRGIMPTNIYTGQKAQQVAEFVSQVAGH